VSAEVPSAWQPRVCSVSMASISSASDDHSASAVAPTLLAVCPGLPTIGVSSEDGAAVSVTRDAGAGAAVGTADPSTPAFDIVLPTVPGHSVSVYAYVGRSDPKITTAAATAAIATRRGELVASFARFGSKNDTYAGVAAAIAWNVIYTP
jgi:hypothetical protein